MTKRIRIGTRESQLAVWQADHVLNLLAGAGIAAELVFIKSDGDIDLQTPLYAMGVQGVFTRSLDLALLDRRIDMAVHSMKDVPVQLAMGIVQAAVLKRASYKDLLVYKDSAAFATDPASIATIATSSIRRKAQWLNRYPLHCIENLRGNVNTRLKKLEDSAWQGAIFAAAGLERIGLRPAHSIELDWMLPAPAQGAIMVVCRQDDQYCIDACQPLNHPDTALCVSIERAFLQTLMGGCSTPISALASISDGRVSLAGNIVAPDGSLKLEVEEFASVHEAGHLGNAAAKKMLAKWGTEISSMSRNGYQ